MKKIVRKLAYLAVPGIVAMVSCSKDNNTTYNPPQTQTALQKYISADTSLSIFNSAIARAGDQALYSGSDSVTVLVPTNNAFRAAGITETTINNMSASAVDSLLRYHFISQSANLTRGSYSPFQSKLGSNIYGYGGVADSNYFNGTQASRIQIANSNATVYRLNSTLGIPYATGNGYLSSDTSLSYYSAALTRAGIDLSKSSGWTTVLAPTNAAFRNAGYASINAINTADSASLRNTLMYNTIPGEYFTNSYSGLSSVPTAVPGQNLTIGTNEAGGTTFQGAGGSGTVGFVGNNQLAGTNTIFQPTNGVLTP